MGEILEFIIDLLLGFHEKLDDRFTYRSETTDRTKFIVITAALCLMAVYFAYIIFWS